MYKIPSKASAFGRLSKIMKPSFWDKNPEDSLANWEGEMRKHKKEPQPSFRMTSILRE